MLNKQNKTMNKLLTIPPFFLKMKQTPAIKIIRRVVIFVEALKFYCISSSRWNFGFAIADYCWLRHCSWSKENASRVVDLLTLYGATSLAIYIEHTCDSWMFRHGSRSQLYATLLNVNARCMPQYSLDIGHHQLLYPLQLA